MIIITVYIVMLQRLRFSLYSNYANENIEVIIVLCLRIYFKSIFHWQEWLRMFCSVVILFGTSIYISTNPMLVKYVFVFRATWLNPIVNIQHFINVMFTVAGQANMLHLGSSLTTQSQHTAVSVGISLIMSTLTDISTDQLSLPDVLKGDNCLSLSHTPTHPGK